MLNNVVLIGRLTADPELRTTQKGTQVCKIRLAVERRSGGDTDFIPVVMWDKAAVFVSRYFRKGQMIAIQGELRMNNYTDKDGAKRTSYEVHSFTASFCGSKDKAAPDVETDGDEDFPL